MKRVRNKTYNSQINTLNAYLSGHVYLANESATNGTSRMRCMATRTMGSVQHKVLMCGMSFNGTHCTLTNT